MNLNPELVEKNDPPIITRTKNIKVKFVCFILSEKPIFDILLEMANKLLVKSLLKLKNKKNIEITIMK